VITPPVWTEKELAAEATKSQTLFRDIRLGEDLDQWKREFKNAEKKFEELLDSHGLAKPNELTDAQVADVFGAKLGEALRYLAGPPISEDDLRVLADVNSVAPTVLQNDLAMARQVFAIVAKVIDPVRFPWITKSRAPTKQEKKAAILASAVLLTAQRIQTDRRSEGKEGQEKMVKAYLKRFGFKQVPTRDIDTLTDAPAPGTFCAEAKVGERKADIPVRLFDGRLMAIECKVSNSSTNSVKRLNNDAGAKAEQWRREFGKQVLPTAMLSGVFKVHNLLQAQKQGLTLFWAHQLDKLGDFIKATRK